MGANRSKPLWELTEAQYSNPSAALDLERVWSPYSLQIQPQRWLRNEFLSQRKVARSSVSFGLPPYVGFEMNF